MIPDMIHTPYIAPRISVMAPPPVTAERFVDELLSGLCMPDGGFVAHLAPSGDPFSNGWNAAMKLQASQPTSRRLPMPVNVIFHNPAMVRSSELIGGGGRRQAKSVLAVSFAPLALTLKKLQTVSSV